MKVTQATSNSSRTMEPGIYHDLSFEDYCELPYLNQSVLKLMDCEEKYGATPKHAKAAFDGQIERDDTRTLQMGRAEHCWICEGEEAFRQRYKVAPATCQAVKKDGTRCTNAPTISDWNTEEWVCGVHAKGRETCCPDHITATDLDRIKAMAEAVRSHEINVHLRRKGWSECTIVYDVPLEFYVQGKGEHGPTAEKVETTLRHKVRIDRLAEPWKKNPHLIVDLKRMQVMAGSRRERESCIQSYGWDVQAAMYCEAVKRHFGVDRCHYIWVFVEEKPPHDVVWIPASEETLRVGADKLIRYRNEWAECDYRGVWPGYAVGNQDPGGLSNGYITGYVKRNGDDAGTLRIDLEREPRLAS